VLPPPPPPRTGAPSPHTTYGAPLDEATTTARTYQVGSSRRRPRVVVDGLAGGRVRAAEQMTDGSATHFYFFGKQRETGWKPSWPNNC